MQVIELPERHQQHWLDALPERLQAVKDPRVVVNCGDWQLSCSDLRQLIDAMAGSGADIAQLIGENPETIVSAASLGLCAHPRRAASAAPSTQEDRCQATETPLLFHQGTLRSGDHLQSNGDVLQFGDVNPGARISAAGHVMVWGRLRGMAHAGRDGDQTARIVALQLRPLQLRIAGAVARGPDDMPQQGLAELARLSDGEILIEAAPPQAFTSC